LDRTVGAVAAGFAWAGKNRKSRKNSARKKMIEDNKKKPNPIDIHVGSRIRLRRNMLGMSQEKLGENLGITFQQIQKYEKGTNRVGASRLQAIASILGVPVAFFFEDAPGQEASGNRGFAEDSSMAFAVEFCGSPEGLQLNRAFVKITDMKVRRKIIELVKSLSSDDPE
jgi:transcriptional regulator with XRE-family HTH domain